MSDADVLYFIEKVREAGSGRAIAGLLLRVPDMIVLSHGVQLSAECVKKQFAAGGAFLTMRAAGLMAVRDVHGLMPAGVAYDIEAWRWTFSEYAAGRRTTDTPGFSPVATIRTERGEDDGATDPPGH